MSLRTVIIGSERKSAIFRHLLQDSEEFTFAGFYDPDDPSNADAFGRLLFTIELAEKADVFIIERNVHNVDQEMLEHFIRFGKHILFDGFLMRDAGFTENLIRLHNESRNCIQIANVLHNKPLYTTAAQYMRKPRFIRLEKSCNAPRPGEFGEWFYNNLSQELDIVMRLADSGIRNLTARPLFLFGNSPDLLNIQIEFDNDAICHISAGRAVESGVNKFRVFQQDRLFHLDFAENHLTELRPMNAMDQLSILPMDDSHEHREFTEIPRPIMPFDSWRMELRNFAENIEKHLSPMSELEDVLRLNRTAQWIIGRVLRRYATV
jgi:hypothetical protein